MCENEEKPPHVFCKPCIADIAREGIDKIDLVFQTSSLQCPCFYQGRRCPKVFEYQDIEFVLSRQALENGAADKRHNSSIQGGKI